MNPAGLIAALAGVIVAPSHPQDIDFIPQPESLELRSGVFELTQATAIILESGSDALRPEAEFLQGFLTAATGFPVPILAGPPPSRTPAILMKLISGSPSQGSEAYTLDVSPERVVIQGGGRSGVFYGVQTLLQLLPPRAFSGKPSQGPWRLQAVRVEDRPRFSYRGMHLDVSRHFFPVEFVKRYIDLLALHRLNTFHWHLTDDNGWRLEIKRYPKLAEISAWRVDREHQHWRRRDEPLAGEPATYGGYYSQEQVRDVIAYAARRHITVIPEIEMPGHTVEVLAAYPELSCTGGPFAVRPGSYWPNLDIFCAGNDSVFAFIENVLSEVMDLFPSMLVHIGGDEADKTRWRECPKCQARIASEGLRNEDELQSYFIKRVEAFVRSRGRRIVGWDEIIEGGLASGATVMSWRGVEGGVEAARHGNDVIMTPTSHCYFDYYQAHPSFEPEAIGGFLTLKKVYQFEPVPPELSPDEARRILGVQGNLWTEFIPTPSHAEYMSLPRMCALAEVAWTAREHRDWKSFRKRLEMHTERLRAMDVNVARGSFAVSFRTTPGESGRGLDVTLETEQYKPDIRYSIESRESSSATEVYARPIPIESTSAISAAIVERDSIREVATRRTIVIHGAVTAQVSHDTPWHPRYAASGTRAMVDGLIGSDSHADEAWQGWRGEDASVLMEFPGRTHCQTVTVSYLHSPRQWILAPQGIRVAGSPDGVNFLPEIEAEFERPTGGGESVRREVTVDLPPESEWKAILVRVSSAGLLPDGHREAGKPAWLFLDEIQVR